MLAQATEEENQEMAKDGTDEDLPTNASTMARGCRVASGTTEGSDGGYAVSEPVTEASIMRCNTAFLLVARNYAGLKCPSVCLPSLLQFATGCLNCADEEDFLNRYSRVVDGKMKKMPQRVVRQIRQKLFHHISTSLDIDECEKESAARELTAEKWGGGGGRHIRCLRWFWYIAGRNSSDGDRARYPPEASDVPLSSPASWLWRSVVDRCGLDSFAAMYEYQQLWNSTGGDTCFVTLKTLQDRAGGSDRQRRAARQAAIAISRCSRFAGEGSTTGHSGSSKDDSELEDEGEYDDDEGQDSDEDGESDESDEGNEESDDGQPSARQRRSRVKRRKVSIGKKSRFGGQSTVERSRVWPVVKAKTASERPDLLIQVVKESHRILLNHKGTTELVSKDGVAVTNFRACSGYAATMQIRPTVVDPVVYQPGYMAGYWTVEGDSFRTLESKESCHLVVTFLEMEHPVYVQTEDPVECAPGSTQPPESGEMQLVEQHQCLAVRPGGKVHVYNRGTKNCTMSFVRIRFLLPDIQSCRGNDESNGAVGATDCPAATSIADHSQCDAVSESSQPDAGFKDPQSQH
jgi:hypothetical protein